MSGKIQKQQKKYWEMRDLVVIGIFAAVAKVSGLIIVLVGGGMNPITFIVKNLLLTTFVLVMLHKVSKFGTLTLFVLVNSIVSALFLGSVSFLIPVMILAALISECLIKILGGYRSGSGLIAGVAAYDLLFRAVSLGSSWLYMREQPELLVVASVIVAIGYLGSVVGLFTGHLFVKELRHACIIRH